MNRKQFKPGDKVKENRQGAEVETVICQYETVIMTDKGWLHVTKAVRAEP